MSTTVSSRPLRFGVLVAVVAVSLMVLLPRPALGCSCVGGDFAERIDRAPAAFVGTATGARSLEDRPTKIIRFEVEQWMKGDLGEFIEVEAEDLRGEHSSCGEMPNVGRVGLFLGVGESGQLRGHTCGLVDPDLMLAHAEGPTLSSTGVPRVMVTRWGSPVFSVFDDQGHLVATLDPQTESDGPWSSSRHSVCPGARLMVQADSSTLTTWDLEAFTIQSRTDLSHLNLGIPGPLSCRDENARSVWITTGPPGRVQVIDSFTGDHILSTEGYGGWMGAHHMLTHGDFQKSVTRVDLETGVALLLREVPQDSLWSVSGAPNPFDQTTAVVEQRVDDQAYPIGSTLFVYDENGAVTFEMEFPANVDGVSWRDVNTVVVVVPTDLFNTVYLIDATTGLFSTVTGWPSHEATGNGLDIFGTTMNGELWHGDINTGFYSHIGSILEPANSYVVLSFSDAPAIAVDPKQGQLPKEFTVPPLTPEDLVVAGPGPGDIPGPGPAVPIAPPMDQTGTGSTLARVVFAGVALAAVVGGVTMAIRRRSDEA